jgi:hypothetical protein
MLIQTLLILIPPHHPVFCPSPKADAEKLVEHCVNLGFKLTVDEKNHDCIILTNQKTLTTTKMSKLKQHSIDQVLMGAELNEFKRVSINLLLNNNLTTDSLAVNASLTGQIQFKK